MTLTGRGPPAGAGRIEGLALGQVSPQGIEFEPAACPVCRSEEARPFASRLVGARPVRLVGCATCGLVYANPRITAASAARLFDSTIYFEGRQENLGYHGYVEGERYLRLTAADRIGRIRRHVPSGDLLDVGSAAGFFLEEARRVGFRVAGIERSAGMADYARRRFQVEVTAADYERTELAPLSRDVVTMWGVLSLFRLPVDAIRKAASVLRPGGVLALNAFHPDLLYPRIARSRWWILTPAMSQVFPSRGLVRLLADSGLRVVGRRREAPYTSALKVLDYLGWHSALRAAERIGLAGAVFRIPLLDCREYIAVKDG